VISPADTLKKVAYEGLGRVLSFVNDPKAAARRTVDDAKKLPMTVVTTTLVAVYKLRTRNQPSVTPPPVSTPPSDSTPAAAVRTAAAQREAKLEAVALAQPVPEVAFQKKTPPVKASSKAPLKAAKAAKAPVKAAKPGS
jgi:hypothetical protein